MHREIPTYTCNRKVSLSGSRAREKRGLAHFRAYRRD